jgi:hypothetical protein
MRPRIIFDTSSINSLERGGESSIPTMKGLISGFDVILTEFASESLSPILILKSEKCFFAVVIGYSTRQLASSRRMKSSGGTC